MIQSERIMTFSEETTITILLIEDNPLDRRIIESVLLRMPSARYRLEQAVTLAGGLKRLAEDDIEVVLLDLCLPDSEDIDTFLRVHKQAPDVPIIVFTGTDDEALALRALQCGAQDYLTKGRIDRTLLGKAIRYAIERKHAERHIWEYQEQLRSLASELSLAEERERRRIARDLHDQVGQLLALSNIKLAQLKESLPDDTRASHYLRSIQELMQEAMQYTRSLTADLSPPILYELGLSHALRWLAEQMRHRHDLSITVAECHDKMNLNDETLALLFRSVRELLVNIIKHAKTNIAEITMYADEQNLNVVVEDRGCGFVPQEPNFSTDKTGGFGLFSIRERMHYFGGKALIESTPGVGTRVSLLVPLHESARKLPAEKI